MTGVIYAPGRGLAGVSGNGSSRCLLCSSRSMIALRPSHAMETLCSLAKPWSSLYSAVSRLTVIRSLEATCILPHDAALRGTVRVGTTLVNSRGGRCKTWR